MNVNAAQTGDIEMGLNPGFQVSSQAGPASANTRNSAQTSANRGNSEDRCIECTSKLFALVTCLGLAMATGAGVGAIIGGARSADVAAAALKGGIALSALCCPVAFHTAILDIDGDDTSETQTYQ